MILAWNNYFNTLARQFSSNLKKYENIIALIPDKVLGLFYFEKVYRIFIIKYRFSEIVSII